MSNQQTLGNGLLDNHGCLCNDGLCEGCNRLAEAFEAMREALANLVREVEDGFTEESANAFSGLLWDEYLNARAALALADKVTR